MSEPISDSDGEKSKDEARGELAKALLTRLSSSPEEVSVVRGFGAMPLADLLDRKQKEKKKRRKKKVTVTITGWSTLPSIDQGTYEDLASLAGEEYEGMTAATAKGLFTQHDHDWDTMDAPTFADLIKQVAADDALSESLGSAMLAFCEHKIPASYKTEWAIRVMAARDIHQEEDF